MAPADLFARHCRDTAGSLVPLLEAVLPAADEPLGDAMRYSALNLGKAVRAGLVTAVAAAYGVAAERALRVAAAVEMVHTYSLIHDDLPAMDNSALRRGKPSSHVQFDEATAILAGDALLPDAFALLADAETHPDAAVRCALISALARASGSRGMVLGQLLDIRGAAASAADVQHLEDYKTGALMGAACAMGGILAESSDTAVLEHFGRQLGWLFQVTDDVLDAAGDAGKLGKPTGQDSGKVTLVHLLGLEGARAAAQQAHDDAAQLLRGLDRPMPLLEAAARYILTREH